MIIDEYVSVALTDRTKSRGKSKYKLNSRGDDGFEDKDDTSDSGRLQNYDLESKVVRINTIYDNYDNLVQIKFDKNCNILIPRTILKIIGLIVKFHIYLTSLTINRGLDRYSIHEICKILPKSHITDICLDGTFLEEANYYLLLENENNLKQLSLARCKIDDDVLKKIVKNLTYPLPSSKTLSVLNIPSNRITDEGVKYLAEALKSNRQLMYLNIADNMITDDGASALLDVLIEFPMTCDELIQSRNRLMKYLNRKKELVARMVTELRSSDDKKSNKKKNIRPASVPGKKNNKGLEKELSSKTLSEVNKSLTTLDTALFEKAENMAFNSIGAFTDPFSTMNTISKDGVLYCCGNNTLAYINLSYNNISYFSLKKLMNVLMYQKLLDRKPRGLINLCIEGNCIPVSCKELAQIDDILEMGLMAHNRRFSGIKKKPLSRGK